MYRLIILSLLFFLQMGHVLLEEGFSPHITKCLQVFGNYAATQQFSVNTFCRNFHDWQNESNYTNLIDPNIYNYTDYLLSPFYEMEPPDIPPSIRKEYRSMTDKEREDFHTAVRMLKQDTTVPPNKYDAIATLHSNEVSPGAHSGPNFPGWHRIFLVLFERAIKEMVPDAILPYWDSTFESNMKIPELSVLFSEHFAGNADGYVTSGPFRDFVGLKTGPLYRNIGQASGPISPLNAGNILSQMRTHEITFPTADLRNSIEEAHNNVHDWIGGQMGEIDTSADDPLFFMHHCFIDYLWSLFRLEQKEHSIDPEFDYPEGASGEHHPLTLMKPFQYFRNIHGYSDYWTTHLYTYEYSPYCSPDQPTCKSKWLTCDTEKWQCVPITKSSLENTQKRILNDYVINGVQSSDLWCYITVQVFYGVLSDFDSYDLENLENSRQNAHRLDENKDCVQKNENKIDIYVETDGISYRGHYLDFVVLEKNQPFATATMNIAMADIVNSTTFLSAYDSCGRLCTPYCLDLSTATPIYKPCTGVIVNQGWLPYLCRKEKKNNYEQGLNSGVTESVFIKFYCHKFGPVTNVHDI